MNLDINTQNNRFNTNPTRFSNATNYLLQLDYDGTRSSSQRSRIYSAGEMIEEGNESSTTVLASDEDLTIGALNFDYGTYLGADYAEVIHYNFSLNETERAIVNNYLSAKYDISILDDIYLMDNSSAGNYDFDVAGIGRLGTEIHNDSKGSGIIRINTPSGLDDNEFLFWGHDNGALDSTVIDIPTGINTRLERVWRVSEVDTAGSPVDVGSISIQFDLSGLGSVTASHLRLLVDTDNDGSFADETPISGASSTGGDNYEFTSITAITDSTRFTLGSTNSSTPLPVIMDFQSAKFIDAKSVELTWITFQELNNRGFEVERKTETSRWSTVGFVDGMGNKNDVSSYRFVDHNVPSNVVFYRLKQLDFDGTSDYTNALAAKFISNQGYKVYPNPASGFIHVEGENIESIIIKDLFGSSLKQYQIYSNSTQLQLPSVLSGLYLVELHTTDGKIIQQRVVFN